MLWPRLLRGWYKHAPPTKSEAIDRNCGGGFWLLAAGLLSVTTSLVVRVIHRGPYIPGWDLIAPTQGHFLASTLPVRDALREAWYQNRHFWLPFPAYSVPFSLILGYLELLWAWPYWVHVCTLASFIGTLVLIGKAAGLKLHQLSIPLLAWGASPMLLSHSVAGYPWASGFISHALAQYVTMNRRLHTHRAATARLAFLAIESSWHVYQPSRSVSVVFRAALLFYRQAPIATQLIQTTILKLHRAGGRGGAPHPPATEGPHWGMGGVRTDGAAEGQDPPLQQD